MTVPMRLSAPLRTRGRRPGRSGTCCSCTCGPPRPTAGRSAWPSRSPPTRRSSPTARVVVLRDHLLPRAGAGPIGDAARPRAAPRRGARPPDGPRGPGAGGARRPAPRRRPVAGRVARRHRDHACRPEPPSGLHEDVDDLLAEADAGAGRRCGPPAGEDRARASRRPPPGAARPRRRRACCCRPTPTAPSPRTTPSWTGSTSVGLACLEQPLAPTDLLGHARLAARLDTPICLDEPLTSLDAIEAAIALGACEVVCLKPARVGGWIAARAVHDRCAELGVPIWVGGMLETGVGRAANLAVAALPAVALPPDLDPRGRYRPRPRRPAPAGRRRGAVPQGPGTGAVPDLAGHEGVRVVRGWSP